MEFEGKKLLVVDDNEMNRMLAGFALNDFGIEPEEASDGAEAFEIYKNAPDKYFDMIMMDIMMPGMDGIEATKLIRESGKADANIIPIIAMTAESEASEIAKFHSQGFTDYIEKPMEEEHLQEILNKYLL